MRHEETGWPLGAWVAREKIPDGYARALENCRLLADGAAIALRGAAVFADVAGEDLRHGRRYVSNGGCVDTVLIAASGNVYERSDAGAIALLGAIAASSDYSDAQAEDRLYIATGGAPAIISSSGGSCSLGSSGVGLPTPPAPTLISVTGGGGAGTGDLTDPALGIFYAAFDELHGRIYGSSGGSDFSRYTLATDAWISLAQGLPALPEAPGGREQLGRIGDDIYYGPVTQGTPAAVQADQAAGRRAYVFRTATETFDAARSLQNDAFSGPGPGFLNHHHPCSCLARPRSDLWNAARSFIMVHQGGTDAGSVRERMAICEISIASAALVACNSVVSWPEVVAVGGAGSGNFQNWLHPTFFTAAHMAPHSATNIIYVLARDFAGGNHLYRADITTPSNPTEVAPPPFTISEFGHFWFPGGGSGFLYYYQNATNLVYRYNIGTNTWGTPTPATTPEVHEAAMISVAPTNQQIYFNSPFGNWRTQFAPGITGAGGGAATHALRYVVTWRNAVTESPASAELVVANVPDGASITIGYPQPPPGAATLVRLYRTLLDGAALGLRREDVIATTQIVDTAVDTGFLAFGTGPPGSGSGGGFTPSGAHYVMYDGARTWWMNFTGARSDAYFSRAGVAETFAATWVVTFSEQPDDDELVGAVVLPTTRLFFKRRQIWRFTGDPGEPPTDLADGFADIVDRTRGANAPRSIAAGARFAYFAATDGIYECDGVGEAKLISGPIEGLVPADTSGVCGFVDPRTGKYHVCLDAATFAVWDPEARRWESTRLSHEAHRIAPIFAAFAVPDLDVRVALGGSRATRYAEVAQPSSALDPMLVGIGPIATGAFERGTIASHVVVRHRGAGRVVPRRGATALAPIALPALAATSDTTRAAPTGFYGKRLSLDYVNDDAGSTALLEGVTIMHEPFDGLRARA